MPFTTGKLTKSTFAKGPESHKLFQEFKANGTIHNGQPCVMHANGDEVSAAAADVLSKDIVGISIHEGRSAYGEPGYEHVTLATRGFAIINCWATAAIVPGPVMYDGYDTSLAYSGNQKEFAGYNKVKTLVAPSTPAAAVSKITAMIIAGLGGSSTAQVDGITVPTFAGAAQGDYILLTNQLGETLAVWLDKDDDNTAPLGAAYLGADERVIAEISTAEDAAAVAVIVKAAIEGATWEDTVTVTDPLTDGTLVITQDNGGVVAVPVPHNTGDTGAGTITTSPTTPGTVTLAGAGEITAVGGLTKVINWVTSDNDTADAFVTAFAADYLAVGVILSNVNAILRFEDLVAGAGHTTPVFANTAGTLTGVVEVIRSAVAAGTEGYSAQFGWALDAAAAPGDIIRVLVKG